MGYWVASPLPLGIGAMTSATGPPPSFPINPVLVKPRRSATRPPSGNHGLAFANRTLISTVLTTVINARRLMIAWSLSRRNAPTCLASLTNAPATVVLSPAARAVAARSRLRSSAISCAACSQCRTDWAGPRALPPGLRLHRLASITSRRPQRRFGAPASPPILTPPLVRVHRGRAPAVQTTLPKRGCYSGIHRTASRHWDRLDQGGR